MLLTTSQAAAELGITANRVAKLIRAGRLKAVKVGRDWLIEARALEAVRERKPGNPHRKSGRK
jgi:excisionase family DNA binding protein